MMKIKIKNRWKDKVIFETDAETIDDGIRAAIAARADLRDADLHGADLHGAKITGPELERILNTRTIVPAGDLIGWKKLQQGTICKLQIPAAAKRVGGLIGRKCRAEYAIVISGRGLASHDSKTKYGPGIKVTPDKYDPNPLVECSNGIHFFITEQEARNYTV